MKNIWFQGGGFATIWSYGVAEEIKRRGISVNFAGGYSAGAGVAAYLLTQRNDLHVDIVEKVCLKNKWSPYIGRFNMFGNGHLLMKHLHEVIVGDPLEFNKNFYDKKLWVPIRGLNSFNGSWRNSWRDYDDLIETFVSTTCLLGIHGELSKCYYHDSGDRRGLSIDGGLFSTKPPKMWNKKNTIIVSPWGTGDLNMNPSTKLSDIVFPTKENLKTHFNMGMQQASEYFNKVNI
jgi:hypothetical protein